MFGATSADRQQWLNYKEAVEAGIAALEIDIRQRQTEIVKLNEAQQIAVQRLAFERGKLAAAVTLAPHILGDLDDGAGEKTEAAPETVEEFNTDDLYSERDTLASKSGAKWGNPKFNS